MHNFTPSERKKVLNTSITFAYNSYASSSSSSFTSLHPNTA